jgi:hypothetical protein
MRHLETPLLLLALAAVPCRAAAQDRPLQSESAETAAARTLRFETGFDWIANEPNFRTGGLRDAWSGPLLRLVKVPADGVEFELEWIARSGEIDDPDFGTNGDWGDVTLRAKWRFLAQRPGRPALAARFEVTLPETDTGQGVGPNTLRMSAQLLLSKQLGAWCVHLNGGLAIQDQVETAAAQSDFFDYAIALERRLGSRVTLLGEVAGLAGSGSPGTDARGEARLGLRVAAGKLVWDAAIRRGYMEADGTWGATAGLVWKVEGP